MKKNLLHIVVMCGLVSGSLGAAQVAVQPQRKSIVDRLSAEKIVWQRGIAAAKKRHIQKQKLSRQEVQYYNAVLKRLGSLTVLLAVIGIGVGAKAWQKKREAAREEQVRRAEAARRVEAAREEQVRRAEVREAEAARAEARAEAVGAARAEAARRAEEAARVARAEAAREEAEARIAADKTRQREWFYATAIGQIDEVRRLLADGFDVNAVDMFDDTALRRAARNRYVDIVELLLGAKDIDVNKANKRGWTALIEAARWGHRDVVELLLGAKDIDVNKATSENKNTALMVAARGGHRDIVELLLDRGADVNHANKAGETAYDLATNQAIKDLLKKARLLEVQKELEVGRLKDDTSSELGLPAGGTSLFEMLPRDMIGEIMQRVEAAEFPVTEEEFPATEE